MAERLIDANALKAYWHDEEDGEVVKAENIRHSIDDMPTIDAVRVVHAAHVPTRKFGAIDPICQTECSNCGCGHVGIVYDGEENYCLNCGARLDGKRKDGAE